MRLGWKFYFVNFVILGFYWFLKFWINNLDLIMLYYLNNDKKLVKIWEVKERINRDVLWIVLLEWMIWYLWSSF